MPGIDVMGFWLTAALGIGGEWATGAAMADGTGARGGVAPNISDDDAW